MSHQEEKSSIYDWDHKPAKLDSGEEGLAFTKGDMTVVMTTDVYWSKGQTEFQMQGTPANTDWRLCERMKKISRGLIPASRAPKAYIEYNPEEHHDMLVEYLVDARLRHQPLDFPYLPHQFDGTPNFAINKDDTWYLFQGNKLFLELCSDASNRHHEILSSEEALDSLRCRDIIGMKELDILKMKDYDTL